MDSIRISTKKRILINDGPEFIEFNPTDATFAERFYAVYRELDRKQVEMSARAKDLDARKEAGGDMMALYEEGVAFLKESCQFMREKIDYLFGAGTSQKCFGDVMSMEAIGEFLEGMTPFIQAARGEKLTQYLNKELAGRTMK